MSYQRKRRGMVDDIEAGVAHTARLTGVDRLDERVLAAIRKVPREKFVSRDLRDIAFRDGPLPIGHGQTISQPYMVAIMTNLLELDEHSTVLEIGTGSGYQAAVLACVARQVYTIERIPDLAREAGRRLRELGYDNVETRCGDGYQGWPEKAPFDGIVVTAAAPFVPPALVDQLKEGGRLVIPIGQPWMRQELMLVTRDDQGEITTRSLLGVAFVPLVAED